MPRLLTILLLAGAVQAAPQATGPQEMDAVSRPVPARFTLPDQVLVKFRDAVPVRLRGGRLTRTDAAPLRLDATLLAGRSIERLFTRAEASLDDERARLTTSRSAGTRAPADLNNYYRVWTSGADESRRLIEALLQSPAVEVAYAAPAPESLVPLDGGDSGDLAPPTPRFTGRQRYLAPAPLGVGYNRVLDLVGATAPDLRVYQVENEWIFGHEDMCRLTRDNVLGLQPTSGSPIDQAHGTAVAGILVADRNGFGVNGMACDAEFRVISMQLQFPAAVAISMITADARPGDVIVTSVGWFTDTLVIAPLDYFPAEFDAIYTASLAGLTYCFGAGNRAPPRPSADLDNPNLFGARYLPTARHSGGIIVGGGRSDAVRPWSDSNYGSRVDCHTWAEDIMTTGLGTFFSAGSDTRQDYTFTFGGTSGAGPIATGVAAALINIVREQNGVLLTPAEVRHTMRTLGTPQIGARHVGPRPDLEAYLAAYRLPDGLRLRIDRQLPGFELIVTGEPAGEALVLTASRRDRIPLGLNRDLLVDPSDAKLTAVALDAAGQTRIAVPVPVELLTSEKRFYFQALEVLQGGARLTNSVEGRTSRL